MHIARTLAEVVAVASPALALATPVTNDPFSRIGSELMDVASAGRFNTGQVPFGVPIYQCLRPGYIALTFDDGPSKWTRDIVRELDEYGFKATFFVTSSNLDHDLDYPDSKYPDLIRKMVDMGHQIGSHTYWHQNLDRLDQDTIAAEMLNNERALYNILGEVPTYMRPPFAACREPCSEAMRWLGYHVVQFSIDTKDYSNNDRHNISTSFDRFTQGLDKHPDNMGFDIVLAHDTKEWTAKTLVPKMLREIKDRGYRAVTVGECLNDPRKNWYRKMTPFPGFQDTKPEEPEKPAN
jgi:peptidoglycan/xylan/chitin deacetylase (PgdA/CDA1 family)